jgi:hypothetical protein
MEPFESYPGGGKILLGRLGHGLTRRRRGPRFMRKTGQRLCAYCRLGLVERFEYWLQIHLDHVVPRDVCKRWNLREDWWDDYTNIVLACAACNEFDNQYEPQAIECPQTLEAFHNVRDRVFQDRRARILACRNDERGFFDGRPWEDAN